MKAWNPGPKPNLSGWAGIRSKKPTRASREEACMQSKSSRTVELVAAAAVCGCTHGTRQARPTDLTNRQPMTDEVTETAVEHVNVYAPDGGERLRLVLLTTCQNQSFK